MEGVVEDQKKPGQIRVKHSFDLNTLSKIPVTVPPLNAKYLLLVAIKSY